jgi:hypothetical protein
MRLRIDCIFAGVAAAGLALLLAGSADRAAAQSTQTPPATAPAAKKPVYNPNIGVSSRCAPMR